MPSGRALLEVRDLCVEFDTQRGVVRAIDGLSFSCAAGQITGIVGESGCGKSTTALAIMGLLPAQGRVARGSLHLDGTQLTGLPERELRRLRGPAMAMVFQDALAALDPTMRVGAQLIEPLNLHLGLRGEAARRRAIELLERVGIPSPDLRIDSYPHEFSGGMRQRVMIAIALACSPTLLIADEPTTALDVTIQRQILELLLELRDETGAGIVLITHDVGVVAETCDQVVVMYAGREVECGPAQPVLTRPRHPYTQGLLACSLDLAHDRERPLDAIPGLPPELSTLPPGCPFQPRCPVSMAKCNDTPGMMPVGPAHQAACWAIGEEAYDHG